ncbi:hypothetical protein VNI00_006802 [Paramarasmius palmivorus]|uniref:F-box domain-containing protein n=1 Tax=Paramarasmius palmivorus TaxID=297713 RepID=A0AAW0DAI5_9AGAR
MSHFPPCYLSPQPMVSWDNSGSFWSLDLTSVSFSSYLTGKPFKLTRISPRMFSRLSESDSPCSSCRDDVLMSKEQVHGPEEEIYQSSARGNDYPADGDALKKEMKAAQAHLERLDATIALLDTERARLNQILDKYKVILHPIRVIPPEIMRRIFAICAEPDDGSKTLTTSLLPSGMPWVVSQVCRSWRSIALSTPCLWTSVVLDIRPLGTMHPQRLASEAWRLRLQLHRSQTIPLDVTIHAQRDNFNHPLMILICTRSEQWRNLRLGGHESVLKSLSLVRGLLPALEHLTVDSDIIASIDEEEVFFDYCPQLRTISLHGFTSSSMKLPWHQITDFTFDRDPAANAPGQSLLTLPPTTDKFWAVLSKIPNVEVCNLNFDFTLRIPASASVPWGSGNLLPLQFDRLTSLTLSTDGRQGCLAAANFFNWLITPKLAHLDIATPYNGWGQLVSFVSRSSCKLDTLAIHAAQSLGNTESLLPGNDYTLKQVLAAVPDLTSLELGFVGGAVDYHISVFSSPVVPHLENLSIVQYSTSRSAYSDTVLLDALEYRWNTPETSKGVHQLRFVRLDRKVTDPTSCSRLEALRSQGLVVVEEN